MAFAFLPLDRLHHCNAGLWGGAMTTRFHDGQLPGPHQETEARARKAYPASAVGTRYAVNPERAAIIVHGKHLGAAS